METEEQIYRDVTFSLDISDDVYQKALLSLHEQRLRYKMGGDEGIHITKQDPQFEEEPNS